jgi:acyl-CoA dehydrogenase
LAAKRKVDDPTAILAGELENHIVTAQLAHAALVEMVQSAKPGAETTAAVMARRTVLVNAVIASVQKALELAGGAGFYRNAGLERAFRDVQAARYHPMPEKMQTRLTGRVALGLDVE